MIRLQDFFWLRLLNPFDQNMDCSTCRYPSWSVRNAADDIFYEFHYLPAYETVCSSAAAGCPGCTIAAESWSHVRRRRNKWTQSQEAILSFGKIYMAMSVFHGEDKFDLDLFTSPNAPEVTCIRHAEFLPADTRPHNSLPLVRNWYNRCLRDHRKCSTYSRCVPPRLLDLGSGDDWVRVVVDVANEDGLSYACLSHCWGASPTGLTTTTKTLEQHIKHIPLRSLPRTHREAIEVCRSLRIRFLWIDSLCIVQDDDDDWSSHVLTMQDIYRSAELTIGAAASFDDDGGLYRELDDRFKSYETVSVLIDGVKREVHIQESLEHFVVDNPQVPLMQRGWVVQEYLLSRRFVSFGPNEIFWECLEGSSCACNSQDNPFSLNKKWVISRNFKSRMGNTTGVKKSRLYQMWHELVAYYTRCGLTKMSDKLPAIAGLASDFQKALGDTYLGGLWLPNLKLDLAWACVPYTASLTARNRLGPSWLWTSAANCPIDWHSLISTSTFTIQHIEYAYTSHHDSLSYVHSGSLTISGILLRCQSASSVEYFENQESPWSVELDFGEVGSCDLFADGNDEPKLQDRDKTGHANYSSPIRSLSLIYPDFRWSADSGGQLTWLQKARWFYMGMRSLSTIDRPQYSYACGMLLWPVQSGEASAPSTSLPTSSSSPPSPPGSLSSPPAPETSEISTSDSDLPHNGTGNVFYTTAQTAKPTAVATASLTSSIPVYKRIAWLTCSPTVPAHRWEESRARPSRFIIV